MTYYFGVLMRLLFIIVLLIYSFPSFSKLIQILHTNDVHSYAYHMDHNTNQGGYDALKFLVDKYRDEASRKGIETIVLDAGDFTEGNIFYMAGKGGKSFLVQDMIGYDAITMGNHDYLMGTDILDDILKKTNPKFSLLGANIKVDKKFKNIQSHLAPFIEKKFDDIKIGILGVTSKEYVFEWRLHGGKVKSPYKIANQYASLLKERGNDLVIGLTHIGFNSDKKLAKQSTDIDLIIGGHSHHLLEKPFYSSNKKGELLPIFQAGHHGAYMGKLLINVEKGQKYSLISYQMIPIVRENVDDEMANFLNQSKEDVAGLYGKEWLEEIVAFSELEPLAGEKNRDIWGYYVADTMRKSIGADIGLNVSGMTGENYPVGPISRADIFKGFPRVFDLEDIYGWHIYQTNVRGYLLHMAINTVMEFGLPLYFSGIDFKFKKKNGKNGVKAYDFRIKGKKINPFKSYTLAVPEGIIRGAMAISPLTKLLFQRSRKTPALIWNALEINLKEDKILAPDYLELSNFTGDGGESRTMYKGLE
jgi:2',3'-cyclic-nucleotide 2'-phosphodiesterase (5'-nucleotidase family)